MITESILTVTLFAAQFCWNLLRP